MQQTVREPPARAATATQTRRGRMGSLPSLALADHPPHRPTLACSNRAVQAMLCDTIDACAALPVVLWQLQQAHPQRSIVPRQWFIAQAHDRVLPTAGSE